MSPSKLPLRNLLRRPARTAALVVLVVFLAFSVFGGSLLIFSLRNGLHSLEDRLGADVIVIPGTAKSQINMKKTLLQDALGEFYMSSAYLDRVAKVEGVARVTAQTYLVTMNTGCCDVSIQVTGFDPETDFVVQPWIADSYKKTLEKGEVVIGSAVALIPGSTVTFFDIPCKVVAKLGRTGTSMDTAAYATNETLRMLIEAARLKKKNLLAAGDPDDIISAIYVKAAEGYTAEEVAAKINIHVRRVGATATRSMISGVADGLSGVAGTISALVAAVWALAFVILIVAFAMIGNERRKEFAVLRVIGASRGMLAAMQLKEALLVSLLGGLIGAGLAALVVLPFSALISQKLALPFLLPTAGRVALLAAGTVAAAMACGALAAAGAAFRLSRVDTGRSMRGES